MKSDQFKCRFLGGAAVGLVCALAVGSAHEVKAQSICTADNATNPSTFDCVDGSTTPPRIGSGTFTSGAGFSSSAATPLQLTSAGSLDATLNGEVALTQGLAGQFSSVVSLTSGGPLSFTSSGTLFGDSNGSAIGAWLISDSTLAANTGTVQIQAASKGYGVYAESSGNLTLTGGSTTVHAGDYAYGLWSDAFNGNNTTNTGAVAVTGGYSRAVIARALPQVGYCTGPDAALSTTVNVTGNVTANNIGITTLTCGLSTINVLAGNTVSVTGTGGAALLSISLSRAETNIDGRVLAATPADRALDVREAASVTTISGTGLLSGTFDGDEWADDITIAAGGVWRTSGTSDFRGGVDSVVNYGTFNGEGGATLVGLETFSSSGAIDLQNGTAGEVLTLSGDYVGSAGSLLVDVTGATADKFVVQGGVSGSTTVNVNAFGDIFFDPILVVDAASSTVGAFQLGSVTGDASPFVNFTLVQIGADYFLQAAPSASTTQAASVVSRSADLWHQSATGVSNRPRYGNRSRRPLRFWGQLHSDRVPTDTKGRETHFNGGSVIDRGPAQFGVELLATDHIRVGVTSGRQSTTRENRSAVTDIISHGYNFGVYGELGGLTGLYADVLVKGDRNNIRLTDSAFLHVDGNPSSSSVGVKASVGHRWQTKSLGFDIQGGLSYLNTKIDGFTAHGIQFDFGKAESLRGHFSARADLGGYLAPFIQARVYHEFKGDDVLTISNGRVSDTVMTDIQRTSAKFEAGFGSEHHHGGTLAAWADIGAKKALGLRAGFRF